MRMGRTRRSKNRGEMCKVFSFIIKISKREIGAVCLSVGQHFSIKRKTTSLTLLDPTCTRDQTAEGRADPKCYENKSFLQENPAVTRSSENLSWDNSSRKTESNFFPESKE